MKTLPGPQEQKNRQPLPKTDWSRVAGVFIIILALFIIIQQFEVANFLIPATRVAGVNACYWILLIIGFLTSAHCIAMCGGINMSLCMPHSGCGNGEGHGCVSKINGSCADNCMSQNGSPNRYSFVRPALQYNFGRVLSYTLIGLVAGTLGSALSFSVTTRGVLKLMAGVFMIMVGISMLNLFPRLRGPTAALRAKIFKNSDKIGKLRSVRPLIVGGLNGLMPCGALYAAQVYALSTGSPVRGAISMLLFGLGTVPLMFGLGILSTFAAKKVWRKAVAIGAIMIAVFGLRMIMQSVNLFTLAGLSLNARNNDIKLDIAFSREPQVINSTLTPGGYPSIKVEHGKPVRWIIDVPEGSINGYNRRMVIREFGIERDLTTGENVIEFTPTQSGKIQYSCWMGMFHGTITVIHAEELLPELWPDRTQTEDSERCC